MSSLRDKNHRRAPIRKKTNATERNGVNYVRAIVEHANCVFREVDRAGDYGHDAFVLLVDGEDVTPVEIALQIKAGRSYCAVSTCQFSASPAQIGFWAGHGLTTVGVVYDPDTDCAWWVDLTAVAKENRNCIGSKTISFVKARWNHFNQFGFENVLLPMLLGLAPRLSLEGAIDWTKSDDFDTHDLGARVLLARFKESGSAWETLLSSFRARGAAASFSVIRGLIRVMGHTDEGFYGNEMPWDVRTDMQQEILNFGKRDLVELLKFVDDGDFERGGTGWGMLALIPPNPDAIDILSEIAIDSDLEKLVRDNARALLGMHQADLHFWSLWEPSRPCGAQ